jgi:hypothetical protein
MRSLALVVLFGFAIPGGTPDLDSAAAARDDRSAATTAARHSSVATSVAAPQTVDIETKDFSIVLPAHIPTGLLKFTLHNLGKEPHEVRFIRLAGGHTFDDFTAWQKSNQPIPEWLSPAGGIGAVSPGLTQDYWVSLEPGAYVVLCSYPSEDGSSHTGKGQFAPLTVDKASGNGTTTMPEADVTVSLMDHHFQLTAPFESHHPLVHLRNVGSEPHQALIVRVTDEGQQYPELAWFDHGGKGHRPGMPIAGSADVPADGEAWFQANLTPGRYLMLCSQSEEDGRHYELGMVYAFTVE